MRQASDEWVIWSEEHGGWWLPGAMGYAPSLRAAGRFSEERAKLIEDTANRFLPDGVIHEVAMPDPWKRLTSESNRMGSQITCGALGAGLHGC